MVTTGPGQEHTLIIGVTRFEMPNARLAAALCRAGALWVLDLGLDSARAQIALAQMSQWTKKPWGVRVPLGCALDLQEIPAEATIIPLPYGSPWTSVRLADRRVLVEVNDPSEARRALESGADELIARGSEGGGRVGDVTTYLLLQMLVAVDCRSPVKVYQRCSRQ